MFIKIQKQGEEAWIDFIKGSDRAFELLYAIYHADMYRYGFLYSRKKELVEDAIHDVFLQVYKIRRKLPLHTNPKTYLFVAMRNTLLNVYKTKEMSIEFQQLESINASSDLNIEEQIIQSEEHTYITTSVDKLQQKLTQKEKEAIYYRIVENLSYAEVAKLMHINEQSAKNMVHRTLNKIRILLKGTILISLFLFAYINIC